MLKEVKGDIFNSDCTIIAHQTNCYCRMNLGFAKLVKKYFPEAHRADLDYKFEREQKLGQCSFVYSDRERKMVFNLYSQLEEEGKLQVDMFERALERMLMIVDALEKKGYKIKIGLPYRIGCGVDDGRGDWTTIQGIIEKLARRYNRTIYLYKAF